MTIFTRQIYLTKEAILIMATSLSIIIIILFLGIIKSGSRDISNLTTIHGVPYVATPDGIIITENLAHADVYLQESVLAKQLKLTVTYTPLQHESIQVGIRSKSFWLSYPWTNLDQPADPDSAVTQILTIPLTDKFQEPDRSIDIMFNAPLPSQFESGSNENDNTHWILHDIQAEVEPAWPNLDQLIDFLASLFLRERAV